MVRRQCAADSPAPSFEKVVLLLLGMLGVVACGTVEEDIDRDATEAADATSDGSGGDSGDVEPEDAPEVDADPDPDVSVGDAVDVMAPPSDIAVPDPDIESSPDVIGDGDEPSPDVDEDVDPYCHTDCFGGQWCAGGVVSVNFYSPVPCWVTPRFEGESVCIEAKSPCQSGQCGSFGTVCAEEQDWAWPGTSWPDDDRRGLLEYFPRFLGDEVYLVLSSSEGEADVTRVFSLTLRDCTPVINALPSPLSASSLCQATLERPGQEPRVTPALERIVRSYTEYSPVMGSVTWSDGTQLMRVDWVDPESGGYGRGVWLTWRERVDAPRLDDVVLLGEGSGEGSGTPIEGSGATDGSGATP